MMKTMKVAYGIERLDRPDIKDYKVLVVKNTTAYHPGQILTEVQVRELCSYTHWEVTIVPLMPQVDATK